MSVSLFQSADKPLPTSISRHLPWITIAVVAVLGVVLLRDQVTFAALAENRDWLNGMRDANYPAFAFGFVAIYALAVAFSLPGGLIITLAGGHLFGLFPGVLFNITGATIGATALFLAVRAGMSDGLTRRLDAYGGRVARIKAGLDQNQWSMLFLIRLVPVVPFFVANLIPAFLNVPLPRFVVSTFIGILPGAFVFTSLGSGLGDVFASGAEPDLGVIFTAPVLVPLIGLCILALIPVIVRAKRGGARI
jgi:uncharacterized membrane protein YdjX (TVP38/TMEM64 family)